MKSMFVIGRREAVKSSIFWAQRCKKHESQMQGCVVSWWSYDDDDDDDDNELT